MKITSRAIQQFLNEIKLKYTDIISEADVNEHKWFELFVDKGNETQTIDSGDTFDETVANFEYHANIWGIDKLSVDIWICKDTKTFPLVEIFSLYNEGNTM